MSIELIHIELHEANELIERLHRHHKRVQGHRWSIGATHNGELVGACVVGRPVSRHTDAKKVLEVTRMVSNGHRNVCSALYGAAARAGQALGYEAIQTFILDGETGASLLGAGWELYRQHAGGGDGWQSREGRRDDQPTVQKQIYRKVLNPCAVPYDLPLSGKTVTLFRGRFAFETEISHTPDTLPFLRTKHWSNAVDHGTHRYLPKVSRLNITDAIRWCAADPHSRGVVTADLTFGDDPVLTARIVPLVAAPPTGIKVVPMEQIEGRQIASDIRPSLWNKARFQVALMNGYDLVTIAVAFRPQDGADPRRCLELVEIVQDSDRACDLSQLYTAISRAAAAMGYDTIRTQVRSEEQWKALHSTGWKDEGEWSVKALRHQQQARARPCNTSTPNETAAHDVTRGRDMAGAEQDERCIPCTSAGGGLMMVQEWGDTVRHVVFAPLGAGRRKGFLKVVQEVDTEQTNGFAFVGEFVPDGRQYEFPIGALVVRKRPVGSTKSKRALWSCAIVNNAETPSGWQWSEEYDGNRKFLDFRDLVASWLDEYTSDPDWWA